MICRNCEEEIEPTKDFKLLETCPICVKAGQEGLTEKEIKHIARHSGNSSGISKDKIFTSPDGKHFKTQKELDEYVKANPKKVNAVSCEI